MGSIAMAVKVVCIVLAGSLCLGVGEKGGEIVQRTWLRNLSNRQTPMKDQILDDSQDREIGQEVDADKKSKKIINRRKLISVDETGTIEPAKRINTRRGKVARVIKRRKLNLKHDNEKEELSNFVVYPEFNSFPIVKISKKINLSNSGKHYSKMLEKLRVMVVEDEGTGSTHSPIKYMEMLSKIQEKQNYDMTAIKSEMNAKQLNEDFFKPDPNQSLKIEPTQQYDVSAVKSEMEAKRLNEDFFLSSNEPPKRRNGDETSNHGLLTQKSSPSINLVSWDQLS